MTISNTRKIKYSTRNGDLDNVKEILESCGVCYCGHLYDIIGVCNYKLPSTCHIIIVVDGKEVSDEEYQNIIDRTNKHMELYYSGGEVIPLDTDSVRRMIETNGIPYSSNISVRCEHLYSELSAVTSDFVVATIIYSSYVTFIENHQDP